MKKTPKKFSMKQLFLFNGLLFVVAIGFLEWSINLKASFKPVLAGEMEKLIVLEERKEVSDLSFQQKGLPDNKNRQIKDFKNNWLIVNFWATWCAPCIKELPSLEKLQEVYAGQGLRVIAIALDDGIDDEKLSAFLTKHNLGGIVPQYYDGSGQIIRTQKFKGYPTTWIVDPYGRHVATYEGDADWASKDAFAFINSFLQK